MPGVSACGGARDGDAITRALAAVASLVGEPVLLNSVCLYEAQRFMNTKTYVLIVHWEFWFKSVLFHFL